ncbi:MAG: 1-acyl-sn-glycerol-3-phosphate acyltransferase [Candidatus Omnitrophica bacterium]|nr:1-acyl-sn-glycerol-3-phosphate acyltransferase [Candidatus Omnitrophota bacterium]MBU4346746.1 1-acyl-sn-glycerol-3-phosphate acyltransferase [Candidatus Omnitrophota bacterium]MBU4473258.1 1-acyl-sn-glycerol-3-phosphate acyltransferase [Candidatus Omnitrophota bacterium]MCG2706064.1 1-acyl-sn-glycerol-3-phosphate acyltransferase [Candidatus Omnitrophota bacterium]
MWYAIFRALSKIVLKLFFRLKVEGLENLPKKNNFIIVANHSSLMDSFVIAAAVPVKIHCISSRFLYSIPWLRWSLERLEALPTGASSEKAVDYLMKNEVVGLFPEGGCSRDGNLREFRRGAAVLALTTGRPIVPCAILGTYQALPVTAKFPKPVPIKLKIAKPVYLLKEFDDVIDDIYLQEGISKIKNIIQEMLDAG